MPDILEREQRFLVDGTPAYVIGHYRVKCSENNISLHIPDGSYPPCPDCGGTISPDGRTVPGRCACTNCGSRFADMRLSEQKPGRFMPGPSSSVAADLVADPEKAAACERASRTVSVLQCVKCGSRYDSFLEFACHVNGAHPEVFA